MTDYKNYVKNRNDWFRGNAGGDFPNYTVWALSNPFFAIDPLLANCGPGYDIVPDGSDTFKNTVTGEAGLSHNDAVWIMRKANGIGMRITLPDERLTESNPTADNPGPRHTQESA